MSEKEREREEEGGKTFFFVFVKQNDLNVVSFLLFLSLSFYKFVNVFENLKN